MSMKTASALTATEAFERLSVLNLSMIRMKLADPIEGNGWDAEQLDSAEREYRRFLALHLMYPEMAVVPCGLVDAVWHAHEQCLEPVDGSGGVVPSRAS